MEKKIKLAQIRIDGGTQSRVELDTAYIAELAESIRDLPWMLVYFDGTDYWLADGFHRYHAHMKVGAEAVSVKVEKGTQRDAILYSLGANARHGRRRSSEDKRRAVEMMLQDEEWGKKSVNWIAQRCAVSFHFAETIIKSTLQKRSGTVETSNGRKMNTANIGKKPTSEGGSAEEWGPSVLAGGPDAVKALAAKWDAQELNDGCSDPVEEPAPVRAPSPAPKPPKADAPPWEEFLGEIEDVKRTLRSASTSLSHLLKFEGKRPTHKYAHFMSHDGTVGAILAIVRYLDDYAPAAESAKEPGYIPGHSAELRKRAG